MYYVYKYCLYSLYNMYLYKYIEKCYNNCMVEKLALMSAAALPDLKCKAVKLWLILKHNEKQLTNTRKKTINVFPWMYRCPCMKT